MKPVASRTAPKAAIHNIIEKFLRSFETDFGQPSGNSEHVHVPQLSGMIARLIIAGEELDCT